jgi:hypothetical protein
MEVETHSSPLSLFKNLLFSTKKLHSILSNGAFVFGLKGLLQNRKNGWQQPFFEWKWKLAHKSRPAKGSKNGKVCSFLLKLLKKSNTKKTHVLNLRGVMLSYF